MSANFEELDYCPTPIGALSLRRRRDLKLDAEVFEIKLGDEHLMSSLFTVSEIALARLGVAAHGGNNLDVVVGGLGLGYTAKAVLEHDTVSSLLVIDFLEPVIEWHRTGLLPLGAALTGDPRCKFHQGDFFSLSASEAGFDPETPGRKFDAILVDIDHSPEALLDAGSESFYRPEGLARLAKHLRPGGVFGLWSDDTPDTAFTERLAAVFGEATAEPVTFHNPHLDQPFTQTVYRARSFGGPTGEAER